MFKRYLIKLIISALILSVSTLKFVDVTVGERLVEYPLEIAWNATGLPVKQVETQTWLRLSREWTGIEGLKARAGQLGAKLGLKPLTKMTIAKQNDFCYVSFEGTRRDGTVVALTLQSVYNEGTPETQLGVNTIHKGEPDNLRQYLSAIEAEIGSLGERPQFNVLLSGQYPGRVSAGEIRELSGRAFQKVGANLVETGFVAGNSSQKGYTRLIKKTVQCQSRRVNIELGTRYDDNRNITEVLLATPDLADGI
jgi:hypothetical protein